MTALVNKTTGAASWIARLFCVLVLLAGAVLSVTPAAAQQLSARERAALEQQRQTLFQRMLNNPSDLDAMFAYADIAAKLGDNEAAVSTLERMLLFNPNLPRVQLELGALYFRLGSYEVARTYFEKALAASPPPPPEVRSRVETYLARIRELASPNRLTGYLFLGAQYQSDANLAPSSPLIHSPIGDILLNSQFLKRADTNLFGTGSFLYSYDLGTQTRDTFDVTGTGFMNHYFKFRRLDLDLGELTFGPRFRFPDGSLPGVSSVSVRPYGIVNEVGLGENQYFWTIGGGVEYAETVWGDLDLRALAEIRRKEFTNAPDRPASTGLDGHDVLVSLLGSKPVTANSALTLQLDFLDQETRFNFYSNKTYAISGAYTIRYPDPLRITNLPVEFTAFLSRSWANYAAPDPCCNTSGSALFFSASDRFDRRWRFGFTNTWRVAPNTALVLQMQRDIVSSNLPLYGYNSNSVIVGPVIRF